MSAAERKLRGLKNRKRSILASLSAIGSFLTSYQADRDKREVPVRLENLIALWTEFNEVQGELETLEEADDVLEGYLKERTDVERLYYRAKGTLLQLNETESSSIVRVSDTNQVSHVKLPDIKLPVFDGNFDSWLNFHDLFVSLVHTSANLSTIQKFYYLRSSLSGEALELIQTIPISNEQYPVAWNLLVSHYQNTRRLKRTYVQSLFEFPCMRRETAVELHLLIDKFQANVKILKQLGERVEHWDVLLIQLLSTRLDSVTRRDWEEFSENNNATKFQQLIDFLQHRVNVLETVTNNSTDVAPITKRVNSQRSSYYGSVQPTYQPCPACSNHHLIYQCEKFLEMTLEEKENFVRNQQLCRNCLRRNHQARNCASESSCRRCCGRHHTQLCNSDETTVNSHPAFAVHSNASQVSVQPRSNNEADQYTRTAYSGITSCASQTAGKNVFLATASIILVDEDGIEHQARALLDSGSECCFASEAFVQRMRVRRYAANIPISGIGQSSTNVRWKFRSTIKSRLTEYTSTIEACILPKVTVNLPANSVDVSSWSIPTGIHLADPHFNQCGPIDVVLGAEIFFNIFNVAGYISLGTSLPSLVNSTFGWIVSGSAPQCYKTATVVCNMASIMHNESASTNNIQVNRGQSVVEQPKVQNQRYQYSRYFYSTDYCQSRITE